MATLDEFGDTDALDNRYIDKCVVYVEGDDDQTVWQRVLGPDVADRIEVKVPQIAGSGFAVVSRRVQDERPTNAKVFGLVDGEVVATHGQVHRLFDCREPILELEGAQQDGLLYLAQHEMENVLLLHSNLVEYITTGVAIWYYGSRDRSVVERELVTLARRFYVAALFKYASAQIRFQGTPCGVLDVGRFQSPERILVVVQAMKAILGKEGKVRPRDFMRQVLLISKLLRSRAQKEDMSSEIKYAHLTRLADGKNMLARLQRKYGMSANCQGHLLERVANSPYASAFRTCLLGCTVNRLAARLKAV